MAVIHTVPATLSLWGVDDEAMDIDDGLDDDSDEADRSEGYEQAASQIRFIDLDVYLDLGRITKTTRRTFVIRDERPREAPPKGWLDDFRASKTQKSDKEMAKFCPQKPKFSDNPLVELPGACDEYLQFMDYAMNLVDAARPGECTSFFLTGQPGIGKTIGSRYFLLRLLSSAQSTFLILNPDSVLYFTAEGVRPMNDAQCFALGAKVISRSWILIDIDSSPSLGWLPHPWVANGRAVVWTSSPSDERFRHFTDLYAAYVWYMKPWGLQEISAVTTLDGRDKEEVVARFNLSGPAVISADNVFNQGAGFTGTHRVFLVRPQEVLDEYGRVSFTREECRVEFLCPHVALEMGKAFTKQADAFRKQLATAFDQHPSTRSAAGQLVESLFHRALAEKTASSQDAFGIQYIKKSFSPPASLHSTTFAAIDALLLTSHALYLIQTSLSDSHSFILFTILDILSRLARLRFQPEEMNLVYCLVGTDEVKVKALVKQAEDKLYSLVKNPHKSGLGSLSKIRLSRLKRLTIAGVVFDPVKNTLVPL
ncbi:hypothetical protein B0H17DRAFT_1210206 [Mycena rosella]|uniref:Uncharacterized protein n=1 Tax=Mycena rosella TaxID=1033263 RepID=A0AAD7CWS0_MYCRO|nr:hypothetical protein B0H17DRAFT_1210206 [Mycena rosella]